MTIVWAGPDGHALARALEQLIADTFEGRVAVWLSTDKIRGCDWRADVQRAAGEATTRILAVGPDDAAKPSLVYQAGACFRDGTTFALCCGATAAMLRDTPLESLRLWDAHEPLQLKSVIRSVGVTASLPADAFDAGYASALPAFLKSVEQLQGSLARRTADKKEDDERVAKQAKAEKSWARRRRIATLVALAAALIVLAVAPWAWTLWPAPSIPTECTSGSGAQRAQCEWEHLVADSASRATNDPHLAARISARPFAVVAFTPTCDPKAVAHEVRIAGQGAAGDGWTIPVVFAKSSAETSPDVFSAITLAHGDRVEVVKAGQCVPLASGAIRVRHIGTLGDSQVCDALRAGRREFLGNPGLVEQVAAFLVPFGLGDADRLQRRIEAWQALCDRP